MSRLYVATSFKNIKEARQVIAALISAGHTLTHDWTYEAIDPTWPLEQQQRYLQECGAKDFAGVAVADAVVLVNHPKSRDAMTEFGVALGLGKPVFVLYPERAPSVFFHRAHLLHSMESLLEALQ